MESLKIIAKKHLDDNQIAKNHWYDNHKGVKSESILRNQV